MDPLEDHPLHIRPISPAPVSPDFPSLSLERVLTVFAENDPSELPVSPTSAAAYITAQARLLKIGTAYLSSPLSRAQVLALDAALELPSAAPGLAVRVRLDDTGPDPDNAPVSVSRIRLIEWLSPRGPLPRLIRILRAHAKAGIWNHVVFPPDAGSDPDPALLRFAIGNPNIVHSWQLATPAAARFPGPEAAFKSLTEKHARLPFLTGRPFWRALPGPAHLLLYLDTYGSVRVRRWWVRQQPRGVVSLGENMQRHFARPAAAPESLSAARLDDICQLVEAGGSVSTRWMRHNLTRAFLVVYATELDQVVAVSSLKHPRREYITALSEQTGLDLSDYLERGYTSVRPEYRGMGIATQLLAALTARADGRPIFSLISEDNRATQTIARRNNTRKVTSFFSTRAGKQMGVWMPEAQAAHLRRKTP